MDSSFDPQPRKLSSLFDRRFYSSARRFRLYYAWNEATYGTKALQGQLEVLRADQRPWVYDKGAKIWTNLFIYEDHAIFTIAFLLENVGKSPARGVNIQGTFLFTNGSATEAYAGYQVCDLSRELPPKAVPGRVIFPNQSAPHNHVFTMNGSNFQQWRNWKEGQIAALIIAGCTDYFWGDSPVHHQTRFIFELDKTGPDNKSFLMVPGMPGEISANELGLAINPDLTKDAD
jgi:hypothetical protein